ncbi:MAG: hypothetical protein WA021_00480 [Minisyncoccia bacterium]
MQKLFTVRRFLVLITLIAIGGIVASVIYTSRSFVRAAENYATLADAHAEAAYVPGSIDNPLRRELNGVLSAVLVGNLSAEERLANAARGLALLKDAEAQIDAIGEAGDKVQFAMQYMEETSTFTLFHRTAARDLLATAREEFDAIADIRALSYRANFHTMEILNRVILDQGEVTEAFAAELNRQLPQVEEQFNRRSNLYITLESITDRREAAEESLR